MDPINDCTENELLGTKLKCLELANAMWRAPENSATAETIVSDAEKFWAFIMKPDELPAD